MFDSVSLPCVKPNEAMLIAIGEGLRQWWGFKAVVGVGAICMDLK